MLRPMLLVGVGGSGGKTLQLLHRELRWRLRDADWKEGVPSGWQFIHIDVPTSPDTDLGNEAVPVNEPLVGGQYVSLAPRAVTYKAIDDTWLSDAKPPELAKVTSWRPRAEDVYVAISAGAGQFRTIGRVVGLSQANRIRDAIGRARTKLSNPSVQPQLQRLSEHLGGSGSMSDLDPQVMVVSSMAGGSGAGMFLDVADIIRASDPAGWADSSIGILYTADVFQGIPELGRQGVMPNSLATLCELMNGYWNSTPPGDEYRALERAGIPVAGFQRRGLRYPLMVGTSNNSVTFGSQESVYEASGKTLAAYMTSPGAQNSINAYLAGNWAAASAAMPDNTPFKDSTKGTVVSAMGMGSMSLGRDRFARYSSQRLARAAVQHALRAHLVGRKVPEEMTFEAARDEAAMSQLTWFINECALDEIGEERNQVLDELRPVGSESASTVRSAIRSHVSQYPQAQANEYAQMVIQNAEGQKAAFVSATDQALRNQAAEWVPRSVGRLEAAVLESVSRSGLEVTVELLSRLIEHVGDVINDLNTEIPKLDGQAERLSEGVYYAVQEWGTSAMTVDNPLLEKATANAVKALDWGLEARLRAMACQLLDDLSRNQLTPLYEAARISLGELRVDEHPPSGAPTLGIADWPTVDTIPEALRPALNERLVEQVDTFPQAYDDQLVATVRRSDDPNRRLAPTEAERAAVGEILTGRARDMTADGTVVSQDTWWPQLLSTQRPPAPARYELRFGGRDVLERSETWTHRRETAMGDYVHESLRDYVDIEDAGEAARRRQAVIASFREVMGVAPPLVEMDGILTRAVHGDVPDSQFHFTAVPFAQTDLEKELLAVAESAGQPANVLDSLKGAMGLGDEQRIEIITTLSAPVQPLTLQSVLRPIAAQWSACRDNAGTREQFWRWRRARALPEFVPVSPEVLDHMVKGWFLGRLLGELQYNKLRYAAEPVTIRDPEYDKQIAFPFPYLGGNPTGEQDLLPAVLESMAVAMLDCQVEANLDALKPYERLKDLGSQATLHLRNWIQSGATPDGTVAIDRAWRTPDTAATSAVSATADDRQRAVLLYLQGRMRNYVQVLDDSPVTKATLLTQPRWLDLRDQLETAFSALLADATNAPTYLADDGGD